MNTKLAVVAAAVAALGWLVWHKHAANVEAEAVAQLTDENGFVELALPQGADPRRVFMFSPVNCPREAGRRSDAFAQSLTEHEIVFVRSSHISYTPTDAAMVDRMNAVLSGDAPIVFVNGRMKANPSLEEVIAEYEAAQR
jgi:hypothetical protein